MSEVLLTPAYLLLALHKASDVKHCMIFVNNERVIRNEHLPYY